MLTKREKPNILYKQNKTKEVILVIGFKLLLKCVFEKLTKEICIVGALGIALCSFNLYVFTLQSCEK